LNTLGTFFGYLINKCYALTENFGIAIIVFTFIVKLILFPISLMSQKNSIKLLKLQPLLEDLKARHSGEYNTILKEQKDLYKKEKYSTLKAILPLIIQIPVIIGVVDAVNKAAANGNYDFIFLNLNLSVIPTPASRLVIIPVLSAVSSFLLCVTQNVLHPLSKTQGFTAKWLPTIFLVMFSGYFAFVCQAGVGLYWVCGNISGVLVTILCAMIYNPKKYACYGYRPIKQNLTREEKEALKKRKVAEKIREKEDMNRFFSCVKELVFFSEASGFFKYFQHFIDYILDNSDIVVHYLTADFNDQVFDIDRPRFETYFCTLNGLIATFMKMDAAIVVMSMPDLEAYQYKRSIVKKDIEYIYTHHGMGSTNLTLRKGALDHFNTIFCCGKYNNKEIKALERVYNLPEKKLVNVGFGLLDMLMEQYNSMEKASGGKPQILIAPSWQKDNIFEYCLDEIINGLTFGVYKLILRPHPEFVKRFPMKMKLIFDKYGQLIGDGFEIQTDFSSNSTVYLSDLVITDWSSISQEFSFCTKKPSLFINTPMKVANPEWQKIDITPVDIWIRSKIGVSVDTDKLGDIDKIVRELLDNQKAYRESISRLVDEYMYNVGNTAAVGGGYIINRLRDYFPSTQSV